MRIATDEGSKTALLARFLPLGAREGPRRDELLAALARNRAELTRASEDLDQARAAVAQLPKLKEQESRFQELGLNEKLESVRALSRERGLVKRLDEELADLDRRALDLEQTVAAWDLAYLGDKALEGLPQGGRLAAMRERVAVGIAALGPHLTGVRQALDALAAGLDEDRAAWKTGAQELEGALARAAAALPDLSGKPGESLGREYMDLVRRIESIAPIQARLDGLRAQVQSLEDERRQLRSEWRDWQAERFDELNKAARRLNRRELAGKLRIEVRNWGNREPLAEFLKALPGVGPRKIEWLDRAEGLSVAAHNANIPVFGDAEWIGTLRGDQEHAAIADAECGAIDQPPVRDAVSEILEGGQAAFEMRRAKYGY